jgi:multiple sugar transport system substrate-binding protein
MKTEDIRMSKLVAYSIFILLFFISISCQTSAQEITNSPTEITFWMMPNEPIAEIEPTIDEINDFAREYNLKFEITDPSCEWPSYIGNGSHIVIVDLNIVDWASVISQTAMLKEIDIFEKVHPDIKIKLKIIEWSSAHDELLKASNKECSPPDALQMPSTWTAEFAEFKDKYVLKILTNDVEEDVDMGLQQYYECSLSSCRIDGSDTLYAIPWFLDARVIYYWKDIFYETNLTEKDIKNWNTFENACEKVNNRFRGSIYAFGIPGGKEGKGKEWILVHNIIPWIYGSGREIIVHKPSGERELGLSGERARNGLISYIELSLNGYTGPKDFNSTKSEIEKGFLNKDYAMIYSGPWLLKPLKDLSREEKINIDTVGTALPPAGRVGTYTFVGGSNLAIWHYQDGDGNFYDAWEFVKFLSSDKESQKRYANATMMIPASREALEEFIKGDPLLKPFQNALIAGYGRSFPSIKEWGKIEGILADDLNSIWKIVGNETIPPARRKSMVETKLEEIDDKCYPILNGCRCPCCAKIKFFITNPPPGIREVFWATVGAVIGIVIGCGFKLLYLLYIRLFRRKSNLHLIREQEEKIAELEKENAELKANLPERNPHDPREHQ